MHAKVRWSARVAVILALVLTLPLLADPGRSGATARGYQAVPAADLDRALRAGDLDKARQLMPVSWAASEQLFVSYLDRSFGAPDFVKTDRTARALVARWADVHFRIVEYDFARAILASLDTADRAGRMALVDCINQS